MYRLYNLSMSKKFPENQEKIPESIGKLLEETIISWSNEKKTGKLIVEIHFNQGGIAGSDIKTESRFC